MSIRSRAGESRLRWVAAALLSISVSSTWAAASGSSCGEPPEVTGRPRIALALAGGGGLGWAHIGVLQVLEEKRIPIDCIAGTSAGSIIGAVYASGKSPAEMEKEVTTADWSAVFRDAPSREGQSLDRKLQDLRGLWDLELGVGKGGIKVPAGVFAGQEVNAFLRRLTLGAVGARSFDELAVPYRAIATDLQTGAMVELDRGDLAAAIRASMAVPGVFTPEKIDGRLLVDGGLKRNLPIETVREMGADVIIAVDLGTSEVSQEQLNNPFAVGMQMINIMINQNVADSKATLREEDVLISPNVRKFSSADFSKGRELIPLGRAAALAQAGKLERYALSPDAYAALRSAQLARLGRAFSVDRVEVDTSGLRHVNPKAVERRFETAVVDDKRIAEDTAALLGSRDFERIDYRFRELEDGGRALVIAPQEKPWGPGYLRFGLRLATDFKEEVGFDILGSYRRRWLNSLGGEWRADASLGQTTALRNELYQPIMVGRGLFVAPSFDVGRRFANLFSGNDAVARYEIENLTARVDLGWTFGQWGEVRVGPYYGAISFEPSIAVPFAPSDNVTVGGIGADFVTDRLDSVSFPTSGYYGLLSYRDSMEALGAETEYRRLGGGGAAAFSAGRHTLRLGLKGGDTLQGTLPAYNMFALGGLFNLSGYQINQLAGQSYALGSLLYYYRLALAPLLLRGLYVGGSLEAGNMWTRLDGTKAEGLLTSGSVFIGADSAFGPFYLAYGRAFDDQLDTVYLYFGTFY
jgi:NTE family protein